MQHDDHESAQAIISIASAFGLQAAAEGVEEAETTVTPDARGVGMLQSWHFGRPMSAGYFEAELRRLLDSTRSARTDGLPGRESMRPGAITPSGDAADESR